MVLLIIIFLCKFVDVILLRLIINNLRMSSRNFFFILVFLVKSLINILFRKTLQMILFTINDFFFKILFPIFCQILLFPKIFFRT